MRDSLKSNYELKSMHTIRPFLLCLIFVTSFIALGSGSPSFAIKASLSRSDRLFASEKLAKFIDPDRHLRPVQITNHLCDPALFLAHSQGRREKRAFFFGHNHSSVHDTVTFYLFLFRLYFRDPGSLDSCIFFFPRR